VTRATATVGAEDASARSAEARDDEHAAPASAIGASSAGTQTNRNFISNS
jgi:hypothetical protein